MIKKFYPQGKSKAFNVSYDDGVLQDKELIDILNKYGIKGTFNLNSALMKQEFAWFHECGMVVKRLSDRLIRDVYKGHEIASHTLNHPYMDHLSAEEILHEMAADRDNLQALSGTEISGFAVPFDHYSDLIRECAKIAGFEYVRTSKLSGSYTPPKDVYNWQAGIFHLSAELGSFVDGFLDTDEELALCQIAGHSYDLDAERIWERIETLFAKVAADESVWFATHIELVRYLKAMGKAVVTDKYIHNTSDRELWFEIDGQTKSLQSGEELWMK